MKNTVKPLRINSKGLLFSLAANITNNDFTATSCWITCVHCLCTCACSKLEKQKEKKRKEEQKRKIASLSFNPEDEGDDEEETEEEEQDCEYRCSVSSVSASKVPCHTFLLIHTQENLKDEFDILGNTLAGY